MRARVRIVPLPLLMVLSLALPATAQQAAAPPRALTASDYQRAERFMSYNVSSLVLHASVRPVWLPDGRFWYRDTLEDNGGQFILVDPVKGTRAPALDHAKVAAALSAASGSKYDATHLPFQQFEFSADGRSIEFRVGPRRFTCDVQGTACQVAAGGREAAAPQGGRGGRGQGGARAESVSPDGKLAVFIRNDNLWLREAATGTERQLTTDGVKDFGYATDNAGWTKSDRPVVTWSPDSKKIATYQQDQRGVGEMYLVETKVGHPTLQAWKYPLPGDDVVTTIQRVVVQVDPPRVVRLRMAPDQHRTSPADDVKRRDGTIEDLQWSPDGSRLAFISTSRDHKHEVLRVANPDTGEVRDVLEETSPTQFESGNDRWKFLPGTNEVIWFSERDNWGQLYLYDLQSGKLKNRITSGEGNVTEILRVDEKNRALHFLGVGKEKGRDPYFRHLYRIGFDGKNQILLTPEDADHNVSLSPDGRFFVDSYSKPDVAPVTKLRAADGRMVLALEKADISPLLATGWKPPMPFTVKARDGVTDLYGLMFRPTDLDPQHKYPVIDYIYPGPQTGSVGSRSFSPARGDHQALAELGFIVVMIDGMGTPNRSKKFHDAYYGDMGDNTLPDQMTGMKQLAERYAWIDIDRAGIWGHSGGGFAACDAMLRPPFSDFFKVGISEAGNHDNRGYEDDWGERWQGLLVKNEDGSSNYDSQANQNFARNLKGHLLLAHGTMDSNVPPYLTLLVVNELIKANKDFDLLLLPNRSHGFGSEPYMIRRRWDYFVRYLMGAEPPKEYEMRRTGSGPISGARPF
jgi:dipeptidyl-peptidase-4